jgi:hypothetical protein
LTSVKADTRLSHAFRLLERGIRTDGDRSNKTNNDREEKGNGDPPS